MTQATPLFSSLLVHLDIDVAAAIDFAGRSGLDFCQWQQVDCVVWCCCCCGGAGEKSSISAVNN
jgi:hypothetical protein